MSRRLPAPALPAGARQRGGGRCGAPGVPVRRGAGRALLCQVVQGRRGVLPLPAQRPTGQPVLRDRRRRRRHEPLVQRHGVPAERQPVGGGQLPLRGVRGRPLLPVHLLGEVHARRRQVSSAGFLRPQPPLDGLPPLALPPPLPPAVEGHPRRRCTSSDRWISCWQRILGRAFPSGGTFCMRSDSSVGLPFCSNLWISSQPISCADGKRKKEALCCLSTPASSGDNKTSFL
ncbi:hypothetical protein CDAR_536031 [Caerostris darwini]|uniref:Uncharacterized protein n=1 Tax=Caerostris darwini TaxID=1538125 RepID=A0AAV4QQE6_9ARAC|nr:hypothetical protein CDAR_536031 [Caerostris darwini]